ncbi:MAG: hypothetical protein E6J40_03320 [Chloroflexi bacterium]|nr:MAG: hypothetical protein E6J40_03320 [Chloroflexota bacterium]
MRLSRILPAVMIAAVLSLAGEVSASAHVVFCMYDPPVQVVTPGGHYLTVNNTIYLPPYERHVADHFAATATATADGHGGTLINVRVNVASGVSSAHVVASVQRFQVSTDGGGSGGTVVSLDLDVPST